jgi:hypothetical protein
MLSAANVRYVAYTAFQPQDARLASAFPHLQPLQGGVMTVLRNPAALPRAYLVSDFVTRPGSAAGIRTAIASDFDPRRSVVLDGSPAGLPRRPVGSLGRKPTIVSYRNDSVAIETFSRRPSILVLSDSYYPGWHARIDGKATHIFRANGLFRAVVLPAGNHRVSFTYRPLSVIVGAALSLLSLLLLATLVFFGRRVSLAPAREEGS